MKFYKKIIPFVLAGLLNFGEVKTQDFRFFGEFGVQAEFNKANVELGNIPSAMRGSVKVGKAGLQDKLSILEGRGGVKVNLACDYVSLNTGIGFDWEISPGKDAKKIHWGEDLRNFKTNYSDFYDIRSTFGGDWNGGFRPKIFSEVQFGESYWNDVTFALGYELTKENVSLRNGTHSTEQHRWPSGVYTDDYSLDLNVENKYSLGNFVTGKPYVSIDFLVDDEKIITLSGGLTHLINDKFKKGVKMNFENGWFVGIKYIMKTE
jgi:hypothetical protein